MNNFIKETTGYVRQHFERNNEGVFVCTDQEFIASDICECVDVDGNTISEPVDDYQPYYMVLDIPTQQQEDLLDAAQEIVSDFNKYGEVLQVGDGGTYGIDSAIGRLIVAVKQIDK